MALDLTALQGLDPDRQSEAEVRAGLRTVLNLVETLVAELTALRAENQQLRDEISRLKGEQGRPSFKPKKRPPAGEANYSSEQERREPKVWAKGSKVDQITIDRVERVRLDRASLPADAEFKGTVSVTVQNLSIRTDNVRFELDTWYSPSERRSYRAAVPPGYEGEFGPEIKGIAVQLAFGANVSEGKVLEWFRQADVRMSKGWLATYLSGDPGGLAAEAQAVEQAGLASCPWEHTDTTGTKVDDEDWFCHVLSNPVFTAYHTLPRQDRLAVLAVLGGGGELQYLWNATADAYLNAVGLSALARWYLRTVPRDAVLDEATLTSLLEPLQIRVGPKQRTWFREALAVAAYRAQSEWPVVEALLSDDAAQYRLVTAERQLCWIHEGRHFKKLIANLPLHRELLATFCTDFWNYYRDLVAYRERPSPAEAARLEARFDALFARTTGFALLDHRIALTRDKKDELLLVLRHPELPLHNNPAELAARRRVRKRDVSYGPRSAGGTKAWDTFMTLAATTQQLGVSFFAYLQDRLHRAGQVPPLADLIRERAATLNLGHSWAFA